jgi:TolB-like protein
MKRKIIAVLLCALVGFAGAEERQKDTVAVPMFGGADTETARVIADLFGTKLVARNLFRVLTRTNIDAIAAETKYQLSGNTSDEDAVSLGKQLNAKYVVAGNLTTLGSLKVLYVQLLNVETGEIISGSEKKFAKIEEAYDYVEDLVGIMVAKLTGESYVTTDDKKFDKDKLLGEYRFNRTVMIASRVTWIAALAGVAVGGMILTDRGTRPTSEYLQDPLFAIPAACTIVAVGAGVSDVIFSLKTAASRKELDQRGIKYAFVPGYFAPGGGFTFAPTLSIGISY